MTSVACELSSGIQCINWCLQNTTVCVFNAAFAATCLQEASLSLVRACTFFIPALADLGHCTAPAMTSLLASFCCQRSANYINRERGPWIVPINQEEEGVVKRYSMHYHPQIPIILIRGYTVPQDVLQDTLRSLSLSISLRMACSAHQLIYAKKLSTLGKRR